MGGGEESDDLDFVCLIVEFVVFLEGAVYWREDLICTSQLHSTDRVMPSYSLVCFECFLFVSLLLFAESTVARGCTSMDEITYDISN